MADACWWRIQLRSAETCDTRLFAGYNAYPDSVAGDSAANSDHGGYVASTM